MHFSISYYSISRLITSNQFKKLSNLYDTFRFFFYFYFSWNEWVTLPVLFSDLPRNAQLALTIYDCIGCSQTQPVGGTTISLFGKHGVFRTGMIDLKVWPNCEADGNFPSQTPGKTKDNGKIQTQRLAKVLHLVYLKFCF